MNWIWKFNFKHLCQWDSNFKFDIFPLKEKCSLQTSSGLGYSYVHISSAPLNGQNIQMVVPWDKVLFHSHKYRREGPGPWKDEASLNMSIISVCFLLLALHALKFPNTPKQIEMMIWGKCFPPSSQS